MAHQLTGRAGSLQRTSKQYRVVMVVMLILAAAPLAASQEAGADHSLDVAASAVAPTAADALPSAAVVGLRYGRQARVPANVKLLQRSRVVTRTPKMKLVTAEELQVAQQQQGHDAPGTSAAGASPSGDVQGQANGLARASYADSRFGSGPDYTTTANKRVGRLLTRRAGDWYLCTASVIGRGLLLTAAHCVCDYGMKAKCWPDKEKGVYQVVFQPGFDVAAAKQLPYGEWQAAGLMVPEPYRLGTDTTDPFAPGVAVNNDIALVYLSPFNATLNGGKDGQYNNISTGAQIGDVTGIMGYGFNGYSFSKPLSSWWFPAGAPATAQLTRFGYPGAFDNGDRMQISNSAGYLAQLPTSVDGNLKNIVMGTAMTAGSSGGPWLVNYGSDASLDPGQDYGSNAIRNVIVGVTSYGGADQDRADYASYLGTNKEFPSTYGMRGSGNIAKIIYDACDNTATKFASWKLASRAGGLCMPFVS